MWKMWISAILIWFTIDIVLIVFFNAPRMEAYILAGTWTIISLIIQAFDRRNE